MLIKQRSINLPKSIIELQQRDPLTRDLYLCELSEILLSKHSLFENNILLENHLLIYCTRGNGKLQISNDEITISKNQFCIIPKKLPFKIRAGSSDPTMFTTCEFNGVKTEILESEFSVVRDLMPSVNNRIANRQMLIDEIFKNSGRTERLSNIYYINFTFSHLLATFIYASKNSDDILTEDNPMVLNTIKYFELNIHKKLTLKEVANEVGFSVTYLANVFKKETNYSPLNYFSHLKISRACEYLDQTKFKIKQIAFMLGYSDPYYFSKDFSKKMGISPRDYRRRLKNTTV